MINTHMWGNTVGGQLFWIDQVLEWTFCENGSVLDGELPLFCALNQLFIWFICREFHSRKSWITHPKKVGLTDNCKVS